VCGENARVVSRLGLLCRVDRHAKQLRDIDQQHLAPTMKAARVDRELRNGALCACASVKV
jgi:hypothetical protein